MSGDFLYTYRKFVISFQTNSFNLPREYALPTGFSAVPSRKKLSRYLLVRPRHDRVLNLIAHLVPCSNFSTFPTCVEWSAVRHHHSNHLHKPDLYVWTVVQEAEWTAFSHLSILLSTKDTLSKKASIVGLSSRSTNLKLNRIRLLPRNHLRIARKLASVLAKVKCPTLEWDTGKYSALSIHTCVVQLSPTSAPSE